MTVSKSSALDELITEHEAAEVLKLAVRTLQTWRCRAVGPAYVRAGRAIRYRRRDLILWIEANTVGSLSSAGPQK